MSGRGLGLGVWVKGDGGLGDLESGTVGWEQYELVAGGKSCSYTGSPVAALPHEDLLCIGS